MDKLKRLLRDVEPTSDYTNEVVYTHIVQNILPKIEPNECPPLAVLVHIAQGIIKPTLLYEDIPSLLDIIGQIEHIRCLAVEQANAALALNTRYTFKPKPGVRLLDASEKKTLKKIAKEEKAENCRMVYREEIILSLYRLHIYRLWTSPQLYTLHKVMRSFFPSLSVKSGDPWADEHWQSLHNIHFTREERELVHGVGEATKAFLAEAYKWDQSRKEYLRDTLKLPDDVIMGDGEYISYPRDYRNRFPCPIDEEAMIKILIGYMKTVQAMVDALETLFPPEHLA